LKTGIEGEKGEKMVRSNAVMKTEIRNDFLLQ
jgi:hypothetical protein